MGKKVTELDPVETLQDNDQIYVVQGGQSKSATVEQVGRATTETITSKVTTTLTNDITDVIREELDEKITYGYSFKNAWPDWQYKMDISNIAYTSGTPLVLPFDAFVYTTNDSYSKFICVNGAEVPSPYFMKPDNSNPFGLGGQYLSAGTSLYPTNTSARFTIVPLKGGQFYDGLAQNNSILIKNKISLLELSKLLAGFNSGAWTNSTGRNLNGTPLPVGIYGTNAKPATDWKVSGMTLTNDPNEARQSNTWCYLDESWDNKQNEIFSYYAIYAPFKVQWASSVMNGNTNYRSIRSNWTFRFGYRYTEKLTENVDFSPNKNATLFFGMRFSGSSRPKDLNSEFDFTGGNGGTQNTYGSRLYQLSKYNPSKYLIHIGDEIANISLYNIKAFTEDPSAFQSES